LASKLKALKAHLKKWNEDIFGNVGKWKKDLMDGIRVLDVIAEGRILIEEEWVKMEDLDRELERLLLYEEVGWRKKCRALWLREGDKNTAFSLVVEFK